MRRHTLRLQYSPNVLAVATIAAASIKPNLFVPRASGFVPVAVRAFSSVVTCVCYVYPVDFNLVTSAVMR